MNITTAKNRHDNQSKINLTDKFNETSWINGISIEMKIIELCRNKDKIKIIGVKYKVLVSMKFISLFLRPQLNVRNLIIMRFIRD